MHVPPLGAKQGVHVVPVVEARLVATEAAVVDVVLAVDATNEDVAVGPAEG